MKDFLKTTSHYFFSAIFIFVLLLSTSWQGAQAQVKEPEMVSNPDPITPYGQGFSNRWGIDIQINNFGFGLAGSYARVVSPYTEITLEAGITGLRDVTEQNFQNFFTGRKIIPNKYNRALAFPLLIGVKKRIFADKIADNFRFFISASAGPAMAFVYPYFNDSDGNGFRTLFVDQIGRISPLREESINNFFTGWGDGHTEWGGAGEIKLGIDLGKKFNSQTTVEFGYFFYYFNQGIQILTPAKPKVNSSGQLVNANGQPLGPGDVTVASDDPAFAAKKFFGTPQISIIIGGLW